MSIVNSVARALSILEVLSENPEGLGITDIAQNLDLHKSTVHRLLQTLLYKDFVVQDRDTKNYLLSFKLYEIGCSRLEDLNILKIASPHMKEFVAEVGETIHIAIRDGHEVVYIHRWESDQHLSMSTKLGSRFPMYCTALGKTFLAHAKDEDIENVWHSVEIKPYTENTITSLIVLKEELKEVRKRGFAFDNEENEKGVICISAPVFSKNGGVEAAVGVTFLKSRLEYKNVQKLSSKIIETTKKISRDLKYLI